MDEHGVDRAVLVQPAYPGEDNSYVADCAADQPDRFAAVCVVNPTTPGAEDRLDYWVRERGCRGLRLRPRFPPEAAIFGDPATFPLWERARDLRIPINILANVEHLTTVGALAAYFPDVTIIIDHMAHPDPAAGVGSPDFQCLLDLAQHPNMYVKPTGYYYFSGERYPYADCHPLFHALYDRFGAARLIWGSDFPHILLKTGYQRSLFMQQREYTFLSQSELDLMMGGNAARLYWGQT
jgi:predicted TIM-barrel fold metal-dependent hydrolase